MSYEYVYSVTGSISSIETVEGSITSIVSVNGSIGIPLDIDTPVYDGEYVVTPLIEQAVRLNTSNKRLVEDVVVEKIPIARTSNLSGGYTVIIGV